jgi:hypothetical protein
MVTISGSLFFTTTLFVKLIQEEIDFAQANHLRGLFAVLLSYLIIRFEKDNLNLKSDNFKFVLIRISIVGLEQLYLYYAF